MKRLRRSNLLFGLVVHGISPPIILAAQSALAEMPLPWSETSHHPVAHYKGEGLAIIPTAGGARLPCVLQRLEGEATDEGFWLTSAANNELSDSFRVIATDVVRFTSHKVTKR